MWITKEEAIWPLKPDAWIGLDAIREFDRADNSTSYKGSGWREGELRVLLLNRPIAGMIEYLTGVHVEGASKLCRPRAILDVFIDPSGSLNDERCPRLSDGQCFHECDGSVTETVNTLGRVGS
jgi:hypothetical protein